MEKKQEDIEFGQRLKKLRKEKMQCTQDQLADKINDRLANHWYEKTTISKWEGGYYKPETETCKVLAEIFNVSVDYLLTGKSEIDVKWQVKSQIHSVEHMLAFLKQTARNNNLTQTLGILNRLDRYYGKAKWDVTGKDVPFIVHPLTVACHAVALGFKEDIILSVALLHDALDGKEMKEEDLCVDEKTLEVLRLFQQRYTPSKKFSYKLDEVYEKIRTSREASFVKLLARCHNISVVAMCMTKEKMARYIEETEQYVIPLGNHLRYEWPEFYDASYLLNYHIQTAVEILKRLI